MRCGDRAELKVDKGGITRGQVAHLERHRMIGGERGQRASAGAFASAIHHTVGRKVHPVQDAVVVVVVIKGVGDAIAVCIAGHTGGGAGHAHEFGALDAIGNAVAVRVRMIGIEIPALGLAGQNEAPHLDVVADTIAVRVNAQRIGAQAHHFDTVVQPVAVRVRIERVGTQQRFIGVAQTIAICINS